MTKTTEKPTNMKPAPTPGGNFVKMGIGMTCEGVMAEASMEIEKVKDKKGKVSDKERYHFGLRLVEDTDFLVGKVKEEKKATFKAGETVILPEHGYLITTMRRTACEIAGKPYVPNEDTDLTPLIGKYFEITRREDGELSSGQFKGKASALYEVTYGTPE